MTKLLNNFKDYSKMIRESKKDLPVNYGQMRTGYINPSGRITYGQRLKSKPVNNISYKVSIIDDFIDNQFQSKYCLKSKFMQTLCPVSCSEFFRTINLEWFRRRFVFDSDKEMRNKCQFFSGLVNGKTVMIIKRKGRFDYTTFVIEL